MNAPWAERSPSAHRGRGVSVLGEGDRRPLGVAGAHRRDPVVDDDVVGDIAVRPAGDDLLHHEVHTSGRRPERWAVIGCGLEGSQPLGGQVRGHTRERYPGRRARQSNRLVSRRAGGGDGSKGVRRRSGAREVAAARRTRRRARAHGLRRGRHRRRRAGRGGNVPRRSTTSSPPSSARAARSAATSAS